ncbi:glycosyltransferase [Patescibacteria group bacterium]|nr:glycosyltransferase [Patescibacteria group bacterium]
MLDPETIIDITVIIPTLNEEDFIGRLLDSIIKQSVMPKELVVVDAYSKDKTIAEIKKRQSKLKNLRYFRIPKSTVGRQRNFGAKKTTSPHLLFLDADMELKEQDILEKYFKEILKAKPDVAVAKNLPDSSSWKNLLYFKAEDLLFKCSRYFWPVIVARNLYIRRKIFNKVGGFDVEIAVGEDQQLVQKIIRAGGKLVFLKSVRFHTSTRRVDKEGRRKYALKMILYGLKILLFGRKKSSVEYEFGNFKKLNK